MRCLCSTAGCRPPRASLPFGAAEEKWRTLLLVGRVWQLVAPSLRTDDTSRSSSMRENPPPISASTPPPPPAPPSRAHMRPQNCGARVRRVRLAAARCGAACAQNGRCVATLAGSGLLARTGSAGCPPWLAARQPRAAATAARAAVPGLGARLQGVREGPAAHASSRRACGPGRAAFVGATAAPPTEAVGKGAVVRAPSGEGRWISLVSGRVGTERV